MLSLIAFAQVVTCLVGSSLLADAPSLAEQERIRPSPHSENAVSEPGAKEIVSPSAVVDSPTVIR